MNLDQELFIRKLYILYGAKIPFLHTTMSRDNNNLQKEYLRIFGTSWWIDHMKNEHIKNVINDTRYYCLTEKGIEWLMQD